MATTMHRTNAALVNVPERMATTALAGGPGLDGAAGEAACTGNGNGRSAVGATGADGSSVSVMSRLPYPTLDQVSCSVAIQRLQWLRHLPAPRTAAEHQVFQRIRSLGCSIPEQSREAP